MRRQLGNQRLVLAPGSLVPLFQTKRRRWRWPTRVTTRAGLGHQFASAYDSLESKEPPPPRAAQWGVLLLLATQLPPLSILRRFKAGPCGYKCPVSGWRHTRLPKRSTGTQPASLSWRSWLSTSTGTVAGTSLRSCRPSSSLGVRLPLLITQTNMQHASGTPPLRF